MSMLNQLHKRILERALSDKEDNQLALADQVEIAKALKHSFNASCDYSLDAIKGDTLNDKSKSIIDLMISGAIPAEVCNEALKAIAVAANVERNNELMSEIDFLRCELQKAHDRIEELTGDNITTQGRRT